MATKKINVNLTFTADANQAKQQIQKLNDELTAISNKNIFGQNVSKEMKEAVSAATKLKTALGNAVDPNTGLLNLSKASNNLKALNIDLRKTSDQLLGAGVEGQKAFISIADSITNAQIPLKRTNQLLDKMWTTLSNTIRWQISATVLTGFTSAIQGAYQYAQDLNTSLNNIRIVTGQNAEQMDIFAKKANDAAKALSTTTKKYVDASLIYYQQGLTDSEVEDRTNTTIKLANVARESAATVSEWMTAIWNNFYDGSKSLEYYADVLTALGAATASSSDEIAGGLEKFAAIANTVGLSYDYAATALATITAQTRQSEDIVGTALKTIFARIEDLELGKTLDDGVSLGQYSKALQAVGVQVLDTSGNLKKMDDILDDLGSRWKDLSQAQKVATAQSVAGTRQYNQIIALMDNWEYFQKNLIIAQGSEGTLQKQADIYAESWEAAKKRVQASIESVEKQLVSDKAFINMTNGAAKFVDIINAAIKSMGGLKGFLPLLILSFNKIFGDKAIAGLSNFNDHLKMTGKSAQEAALATKEAAVNMMAGISFDLFEDPVVQAQYEAKKQEYDLEQEILNINKNLTEEQQRQLTLTLDYVRQMQENKVVAIETLETLKQEKIELENSLQSIYKRVKFNKLDADQLKQINKYILNFSRAKTEKDQTSNFDKIVDLTKELGIQSNITKEDITQMAEALLKLDNINKTTAKGQKDLKEITEQVSSAINNTKKNIKELNKMSGAEVLMNVSSMLSSLAFAFSSLSSISDTLNDETLSPWEKFTSILMSLSFALSSIITLGKTIKTVFSAETAATIASTISKVANAAATRAQAKAEKDAVRETKNHTNERKKQTVIENIDTKQGFFSNLKNNWNTSAYLKKNPNLSDLHKTGRGAWTAKGRSGFISNTDIEAAGAESLVALGKMAGGIGLVVAALATLTTTIIVVKNIFDKAEKESVQAAKDVSALGKEFSTAQSKYSEMLNTMSEYKEGVKSLGELTKGTTEYQQAILKANEAAIELINTYKLTKQTTKDGLIQINEVELLKAQQKQLASVTSKQLAYTDAIAYSKEKENIAKTTEFNRKVAKGGGVSGTAAGTTAIATAGAAATTALGIGAYGALSGATLGSAVPGIGTAIGAIVGLIAGIAWNVIEGQQTELEQKATEGLVNIYEKRGNEIFSDDKALRHILEEELKINDTDLVNSLTANVEETKKLVETLSENNKVIKAQDLQGMLTFLSSDKSFLNSDHQIEIATILANSEAYSKAEEEIKSKAWKGRDSRIHKAYAEYAGYDTDSYTFKDTNSGTAKIIDKKTGEQIDEISDEAMVEALVSQYAREMASKNLDIVQRILEEATNIQIDQIASEAIAGFLSKDYDKFLSLNSEQMETAKEQLKNLKLTSEEWQALGFKDAKDYQAAFDAQIKNWESLPESIREAKQAKIKQEEYEQKVAETATSLGVAKEALNGYISALQTTYSYLDDNTDATLACAKANISMAKGIEDLKKAIEDNLDVLTNWNENAFETYEAAGQVQTAIKTMFGVDVSSDYVKKHLTELQELIQGNVEHLEDLQAEAAKDYIINLGLSDDAEASFNAVIDNLIQENSKGLKIGAEVDLGNSVESLNKFLEQGLITTDQLQAAFNAIGYEPDIDYVDAPGPTTHMETSAVLFNGFKIPILSTDSTSTVKVPRLKSSSVTDSNGNSYNSSATKITSTSAVGANLSGLKDTAAGKVESNKKDLKDEVERYHEINEALEDTKNQLDAISKAKDRAFGPDKLKYMDQEVAKQKELLNLEKQKTQEAQNYYKTDRAAILKYGANLDSSGRITNYDELFAAQVNAYNAVGQRTGWAGDAFEKQQKSYEAFKKAISQYEETLNLIEDQQQKVVDIQNELADLALEKIQFQVEFKIAIEDDKLKYIEFLMQKLEDDSFAAAESIGLLGREASSALTKIKAAEEGISAIMANVRSSGIMTDAQAEALRDYRDNIIDLNSQLLELRNTVQDKLTAAFDAWNEKLDKNTSKLSHLRNLVNNYKNIIDIVGKDNLGISDETMEKIRVVQMKTANDQLSAAKAAMDAAKKTLSQYEAARNAASARGDQESVEEWNKQIETVEEKLRELTENFQTTWADALQVVADAFESRVDQIVENFSESVSGIYKNLDELSEFMEREKEIDERYLDNFEKVYEINKLNREVNNSINNAASEVTAKKLRDFQENLLAMQKEGVNVSKYDVEFMQKKYDLLVAEAALRDAQNAKSVVRLRRDSEGNFGYIYTADQDNVANAQQKYDDALYAMQKFGKESLQTAQEQIIGLNKAYADAIKQLEADTTLNKEEKAKKMAELTQYYSDMLRYWTDEARKRTQEGLDINTSFNAGMAESFEQTLLQKIFPDIRNWETLYETSQSNMQKAGQEFVDACKQYSIETGESFDKAGQKASDMDTAISDALKDISDKSGETADDTETMTDNMVSAMGRAVTAVEDFQRTYSSQMQTIRSANQQTIESVNKLIEKYQGMINKANEAAKVDLSASGSAIAGGSGGGNKPSGKPITESPPPVEHNKNLKTYKIEAKKYVGNSAMYKISGEWYSSAKLKEAGLTSAQMRAVDSGKNTITLSKNPERVHFWYNDDGSIQVRGRQVAAAFPIFGYNKNGAYTGQIFNKDIENNYLNYDKIIGYKPYKNGSGNWYIFKNGTYIKQSDLHKILGRTGKYTPATDKILKQYDTGGYTGAWGTDGRLALLHQKELVLNSSDTENFLSAVSILRDITSQIDLQAASMSYNNILDSTRFTAGAQRDTLEQNVTIHAEFPNATDHTEIEQAFQNLSNLASQYAGRRS